MQAHIPSSHPTWLAWVQKMEAIKSLPFPAPPIWLRLTILRKSTSSRATPYCESLDTCALPTIVTLFPERYHRKSKHQIPRSRTAGWRRNRSSDLGLATKQYFIPRIGRQLAQGLPRKHCSKTATRQRKVDNA